MVWGKTKQQEAALNASFECSPPLALFAFSVVPLFFQVCSEAGTCQLRWQCEPAACELGAWSVGVGYPRDLTLIRATRTSPRNRDLYFISCLQFPSHFWDSCVWSTPHGSGMRFQALGILSGVSVLRGKFPSPAAMTPAMPLLTVLCS